MKRVMICMLKCDWQRGTDNVEEAFYCSPCSASNTSPEDDRENSEVINAAAVWHQVHLSAADKTNFTQKWQSGVGRMRLAGWNRDRLPDPSLCSLSHISFMITMRIQNELSRNEWGEWTGKLKEGRSCRVETAALSSPEMKQDSIWQRRDSLISLTLTAALWIWLWCVYLWTPVVSDSEVRKRV